jgi:hypothetical protein
MNAIAAPKSAWMNRLEGFALIAMFQGFPTMASLALLLKLVGGKGGGAIFVLQTTLGYALVTLLLARIFPAPSKYGCEPLFFDASLSFTEKIVKWLTQPATSPYLLTTLILMALLAVGVASLG